MRQLALGLVVVFLLEAPRLDAQQLSAGARVRVRGTDMVAPLIGSYQAVRNDTLIVLEDGVGAQRWSFPVRDVRTFEVSKGMGRHDAGKMRKWGLIGGFSGAALGFLVSKVLDANAGPTAKYNAGLGAVAGLAIGAGAGVLYGSTRPVEKWGTVPVPKRVGAGLAPRGAYVGLDLRF